jgi:hypothetical protein
MAADCSVNSPTASSPCCTFLRDEVFGYHAFIGVFTTGRNYVLCMQTNPSNTVGAQEWQARLDSYTSFWDANECWGGHLAWAPGDGIETMENRQDFARRVPVVKCEVHFRVDGDWTTWTSWSACQDGNSTRSHSCTNPAPAMGGANCTGAATEQQPCALSSTASSRASSTASSSTASANRASTGTNDQGAFGSAPSENSQGELIGAAFSISSIDLLCAALPLLALVLLSSA